MKLAKALVLAVTLFGAAPSLANDYRVGSVVIDQPWSRAMPAGAAVASGYLTITNTGNEPDWLLAGKSDAAEAIEIHESTMTDGVARMRPVADGLTIPPGQTLKLAPGAAHIMIVNPTQPLKVGERFPATLTFEKAGDVMVEFAVVSMGATPAKPENHQAHGAAASQ